jgi:hypothetical protein
MEKTESKNTKTKMNKTWILVAVLVIITVILLVVSLTAKNTLKSPTTSKEMTQDVAHTSLFFSDDIRPSTTSGTYEMDINIDTNDNKVTFAQLEMSYDPKNLTRVDIKPGTFIKNPVIIQKNINNGRIKYWIGIEKNQKGIQGKGILATLTFTKSGANSAEINFLPKTSVSAAGTDQSVLKNMVSGYINTLPNTTSPSPISNPVISQ